jgi:uncharacterized linocin/CFP29 family protein
MNGNLAGLGRDKVWSPEIWEDIDKAVTAEAHQVRIVQKVFPTTLMPNAQSVPADIFHPENNTIEEGQTKPLVEIFSQFALTQSQVDNESTHHTGQKLARLVAKAIALVEDGALLLGRRVPLPPNVKITTLSTAQDGLLDEAFQEITVDRLEPNYPDTIFRAVVQGISELTALGHPGPYALFLETGVFADAYEPSETLVTPADRIVPLLKGGFYSTGALSGVSVSPSQRLGLLASLGGEPVTIYVAVDTVTAFTQADPGGILQYRVFERIQHVTRDPRALLRLRFLN